MLPFSSCDCNNRCKVPNSQSVNQNHDTTVCIASHKNLNAICQPNMFDSHRASCIVPWFCLEGQDRRVHQMELQNVAFPNSIHICPLVVMIVMVYTLVPRTFYSIVFPLCRVHRYSVLEFDLNHGCWHR